MNDIIRELRERAHAIAVARRKEWWDAMTPAEQRKASARIAGAEIGEEDHLADFKPGVIEFDEKRARFDPYSVQLQLIMVDCFVPLEELASHNRADRIAASYWATTVSLNASDNDVMIGPRPEWLPSRDSIAADDALQADYEKNGGIDHAERIWGDEWTDPDAPLEDPGETITEEQAALLDALEHIEEVRTLIRKTLGMDAEQQDRDDTRVDAERSEGSTT